MTIRKLTFVTILITTFVLVSCSKDDDSENGSKVDTHEYVDLGLPSGTLWATCNIGASRPEEYGDYFAWGETKGYNSGKNTFDLHTYKWRESEIEKGYIKYCREDNKSILDPEDDAATINWGSNWRMPTEAQMLELYKYTTSQSTLLNGVKGEMLTSRINGLHIFFPAAGFIEGETFYYKGSSICFWSCEISHWDISKALTYGGKETISKSRERGINIRPVRAKR